MLADLYHIFYHSEDRKDKEIPYVVVGGRAHTALFLWDGFLYGTAAICSGLAKDMSAAASEHVLARNLFGLWVSVQMGACLTSQKLIPGSGSLPVQDMTGTIMPYIWPRLFKAHSWNT